MPQVPVTQGNSVTRDPRVVGAVRPVQMDNSVGEGLQQAGHALRVAAEQENQIQEVYAQAAILDGDNNYAVAVAENNTEFGNLKGATPAQEMEERLKGLDGQLQSIVENAPERARIRLKRSLGVRYENARFGMQKHADAEMFKFRDAGLEAGIEIASKEAVRGYGTNQFDLNLGIAQLRLEERAKLNGWAPEQIVDETAKLSAAVRYDAVVALATNGEPTAALEQAEEWKPHFAPEQFSRLNNLLRPRAEAKIARELAPVIIENAADGIGGEAPKPSVPGNLPTDIRYRVKNNDGSISTVRTISIGTEEGEVLIPTVIGGKVVSDKEAIAHYEKTGENFGTFANAKDADAYAEWLHDKHAAELRPGGPGKPPPVANAKPIAEQIYPGIRITSNRRAAGAAGKAGSKSWHVKSGAAIDAAPIQGLSFQQYVQGYRDAGYSIIEALDETDPATMKRTGATGPHWHVVLGEKGSGATGDGAALDPRMDPEFAETAARKYAADQGLSESQTDALVDAARDRASENMQRRNLVEREEERQFDEAIVAKGIDIDNVTSESDLPAGAWDGLSPSSQAQKRQQFARNKDRIAKEREAAFQSTQLQQAILAGGAVDYGDSGTKKAADNLYAQQLAARGQMGPQDLMRFNVQFATQIGFVPPALRGQIRGQLRSANPQMQISAAATLAEIGARNPAILNDFSDAEVARAEQLNYYLRRGFTPADSVSRVAETERLTKGDQQERREQFTSLAKQSDSAEEALEDAFGVAASPALVGEFKGLWQQEFIRTGDMDLARSTALAALRRTWGVSHVNGREQVMKNPPELHYGRLDRGEEDAAWIRDQAFKELYGSGISAPNAKDRFELRLWNRTINGQPVYIGTLRQPDGTIVTAIDQRGRPKLYQPDFSQSDVYKSEQRERSKGVQRARAKRGEKRGDIDDIMRMMPRGPKI